MDLINIALNNPPPPFDTNKFQIATIHDKEGWVDHTADYGKDLAQIKSLSTPSDIQTYFGLTRLKKGYVEPAHTHSVEVSYCIFSGELTLIDPVNNTQVVLSQGCTAICPRNKVHIVQCWKDCTFAWHGYCCTGQPLDFNVVENY
jgi:quercetin dioxygenase-like cupin family protein